MANKLQKKAEELERAYRRANLLSEIYTKLEREMQWDAMVFHEADEDHEEAWYTAPEKDDWNREQYEAWIEVLEAVEKLVK